MARIRANNASGGSGELPDMWVQLANVPKQTDTYISTAGYSKAELIIYTSGSISANKAKATNWSTGTFSNTTYIQNNVGVGTYNLDISGDFDVLVLSSNNVSYSSYARVHLYN